LRKRRTRGFTLIELLTVIAIIGMIMALLLAAINLARQRARRAQAQAEVRELVKAWKSYWSVYGEWPSGVGLGVNVPMTGDMMRILQGDNPQQLKFMDVPEDALENGYTDPWGGLYEVDFSRTVTESIEYYQTTVHFPNRKRYLY
jgi:prepilin-type N-terminal cleavage/methylation domain-containing protein